MDTFEPNETDMSCWICGFPQLLLVSPSTITSSVTNTLFRVTDASYGQTFRLYRCSNCRFLQCTDFGDPLRHYITMQDDSYLATSVARSSQMKFLLNAIAKHKKAGTLLDVGAGSGLLVAEAIKRGYKAEGVEPSTHLQGEANSRGIPIRLGTLNEYHTDRTYDIITCIDVVEHVTYPVALLSQIRALLSPHGIGVIVTPDVNSVAARTMGRKWWHYRPAHIGYFDRATITLALAKAGLRPIHFSRPTWHLPVSYLLERLLGYVHINTGSLLIDIFGDRTISINLYDSLLVFFTHHEEL